MTHSLLADMKGDVARLYGCWNEAAGIAERMTVVVGPDGIIRYVIHNNAATVRDQKEALAAV
jgi:alkyl hydroperoxide reductase subunit AhpC